MQQQRTRTLETSLADALIGELARHQAQRTPADPDDRYPLIEILRDVLFDPDATVPYGPRSAPYERVDVGVELAPRRPARNRPATIARTTLAEHARRTARYSAPYARIDIEHAPAALASNTFEAAWFVSPDDAVDAGAEPQAKSWPWLAIGVAVLAAITIALLVMA